MKYFISLAASSLILLSSCRGAYKKQIIEKAPEITLPVLKHPCPTTYEIPEEAQVYFSPNGGALQAIISDISNAQDIIYVQAYSFTSLSISNALIDASRRGIKVEVLLDKSNLYDHHSEYQNLTKSKAVVCIDDKHAIAHNKIIIIDEKKVLTGSYNFTAAANNSNAENSLHLNSSSLAAKYLDNWQEHKKHSVCR